MINYKPGKSYILNRAIKVRTSPSLLSPQKYYKDLMKQDQANAFDQLFAVLKPNTKVIAMKIIRVNNQVWIKIPSGYICAQNGKEIYINDVKAG